MSAPDPSGRDLPLIQWGEALRRDAAERARLRRWVLYWLLAFWVMFFNIILPPAPRLVWNASASAPEGLYHVVPGAALRTDDMVVAWVPAPFRKLAATRRYLPENVPLVKRIVGVPGDEICAFATDVFVDGHKVAVRAAADGQNRKMPWWTGCQTLRDGEYFLLMEGVAASFDGRYFGISRRADIIGKANLLWHR